MRFLLILLVLVAVGAGSAFATLKLWKLPAEMNVTESVGDAKRGAYLARLSGCVACHTAEGGQPLAGGVVLPTKFGSFVSPNITPDQVNGIGAWTFVDFSRALRQGISPEGHSYYPAFPFEFYGSLTDRDVADIWSALQSLPSSTNVSQNHDVGFPFNIRDGLKPWRSLFAQNYSYTPDVTRSDNWNRGKYLVEGPAHCAACHTPRNIVGGLVAEAALTGDPKMLDGGKSPAITATALSQSGWTVEAIVSALRTGITPSGDVFGGSMAEVVNEGTSYLLTDHLTDIALYLLDKDQ